MLIFLKIIRDISIALIGGILLGSTAAYGDTISFENNSNLIWFVTSYLNTTTVWGASAFLIGTISRSKARAAFLGIVMLLSAVLSYYIYGVSFGNRSEVIVMTILRAIGIWSTIAFVIAPVYAVAGSVWRFSSNMSSRMLALASLQILVMSENGYNLLLSGRFFIQNIAVNMVYIGIILISIFIPFIVFKDLKKLAIVSLLSVLISLLGTFCLYILFGYIRGMGI